ncbi:helix-turn-helix transcriptional regulator [Mesorhizobium denitrificans]|uniref:AlpA family phage regulatory protein n=1 Tax=Mesorhizobium denitrificans TaxID=2294114 RepID=A0A371XEY5_9HYPH|nr:AlpA family phage regulatory protein [Mesorhizobium denitrificans]RFC67788.1 AlpA family phage regulatory protein [Mesorhizobium denitrificans]
MTERLLTEKEVTKIIGLSRVVIWEMRKRGDFPQPLKLTPGQTGAIRWRLSEIENWIETRERAA